MEVFLILSAGKLKHLLHDVCVGGRRDNYTAVSESLMGDNGEGVGLAETCRQQCHCPVMLVNEYERGVLETVGVIVHIPSQMQQRGVAGGKDKGVPLFFHRGSISCNANHAVL